MAKGSVASCGDVRYWNVESADDQKNDRGGEQNMGFARRSQEGLRVDHGWHWIGLRVDHGHHRLGG